MFPGSLVDINEFEDINMQIEEEGKNQQQEKEFTRNNKSITCYRKLLISSIIPRNNKSINRSSNKRKERFLNRTKRKRNYRKTNTSRNRSSRLQKQKHHNRSEERRTRVKLEDDK